MEVVQGVVAGVSSGERGTVGTWARELGRCLKPA